MAREGVPLIVIQRQLGHSNLGITSVYLQGIDKAEIIETVHARRAPMIPVSTSLATDRTAESRRCSSREAQDGSLSSRSPSRCLVPTQRSASDEERGASAARPTRQWR
jgi:hypothetical protein